MSRKGVITFAGNPLTLLGTEIKVGDVAPDFTVLDNGLNPVKLSDAKGKTVILSIAPSLDTSVCAAQTRRFNQEAASLDNTAVYCISVDLPFALGRFCSTEGIENVSTLSDHKDLDFGMKYGYLVEELRLLARGIVVVGEDGVVKHVEIVPEMTDHPNYELALEKAKA